MTTFEPEPLLTPGEVAAAFRVNPTTIRRWVKAGYLSCLITPGGHRRFREFEVRALLRGAVPAIDPAVLAAIGVDEGEEL